MDTPSGFGMRSLIPDTAGMLGGGEKYDASWKPDNVLHEKRTCKGCLESCGWFYALQLFGATAPPHELQAWAIKKVGYFK